MEFFSLGCPLQAQLQVSFYQRAAQGKKAVTGLFKIATTNTLEAGHMQARKIAIYAVQCVMHSASGYIPCK